MGLGGINIWQLLIILVIVLLLFGTKRLRNIGGDLGGALKGFKKAMDDDNDPSKSDSAKADTQQKVAQDDEQPSVKPEAPSEEKVKAESK